MNDEEGQVVVVVVTAGSGIGGRCFLCLAAWREIYFCVTYDVRGQQRPEAGGDLPPLFKINPLITLPLSSTQLIGKPNYQLEVWTLAKQTVTQSFLDLYSSL